MLDYDGRNKTVKASEMADIDQSGMAFGEGPRVAAFKGEQAITSAMMDLVEGKKKTLGYVTGHKEPPLSEGTSPISVLKTFIENENIKFQELNLLDLDAIPADVKACNDCRTAIRFFRSRNETVARFLGQTGPDTACSWIQRRKRRSSAALSTNSASK